VQNTIVENISNGVLSIPPPILSRSFQELANGMVAFHEAVKVSTIPFPFPYAQTCDCLLILHWLACPILTAQWVTSPWWAGVFTFIQVLALWSLNFIGVELENPFGEDANDLDMCSLQLEMNRCLLLLISPEAHCTPKLTRKARISGTSFLVAHAAGRPDEAFENTRASLCEIWAQLTDENATSQAAEDEWEEDDHVAKVHSISSHRSARSLQKALAETSLFPVQSGTTAAFRKSSIRNNSMLKERSSSSSKKVSNRGEAHRDDQSGFVRSSGAELPLIKSSLPLGDDKAVMGISPELLDVVIESPDKSGTFGRLSWNGPSDVDPKQPHPMPAQTEKDRRLLQEPDRSGWQFERGSLHDDDLGQRMTADPIHSSASRAEEAPSKRFCDRAHRPPDSVEERIADEAWSCEPAAQTVV